MTSYIIAIDGHSSCGKSTLAKDVAQKLQYKYIDTGAMYRAVTLYAVINGIAKDKKVDAETLKAEIEAGKIQIGFTKTERGESVVTLNKQPVENEIRQADVNAYVSPVAALAFVRKEMRTAQQQMGKQGGVVMEGRDIGTAVFPNADLKVFLTAKPDIRAKRRHKEQLEKGMNISLEDTQKNLLERDRIDSARETDPLRKADDARILDNSYLTREQQSDIVVRWVKELDS